MKNITKILFTFIVPIALISAGCNKSNPICETRVNSVTFAEFGDVDFSVTFEEFNKLGFDYMDLIDATFNHVYIDDNGIHFDGTNEQSITFEGLPLVANYNEVGYFAPCLCNYQKKTDRFELAPGMHAIKNYAQELYDHRDEYTVTFKMVEKSGFAKIDEVVNCEAKVTFEQTGYSHDTFANVRDVTRVGNIKDKMKPGLYIRGSTPFDPKMNDNNDGRHLSADFLLGEYNVTHEVSLATKNNLTKDSADESKKYRPLTRMMKTLEKNEQSPNTRKIFGVPNDETQNGTHEYLLGESESYDSGDTFFVTSMGSDYFTTRKSDNDKLEGGDITLEVLRYFKNTIKDKSDGFDDPIFYLNCNEGKDRTGYFSMLIEALCGVSFKDIVSDFMLTFTNYFHKFNRYDEASIKMYDMMKIQTVYRYVYALTCEDPVKGLSRNDWGTFDIIADLNNKGLSENDENTGEKMKKLAEDYVKNVLCKRNEATAKEIYEPIQEYFSKKD